MQELTPPGLVLLLCFLETSGSKRLEVLSLEARVLHRFQMLNQEAQLVLPSLPTPRPKRGKQVKRCFLLLKCFLEILSP